MEGAALDVQLFDGDFELVVVGEQLLQGEDEQFEEVPEGVQVVIGRVEQNLALVTVLVFCLLVLQQLSVLPLAELQVVFQVADPVPKFVQVHLHL